MLGVISTDQNCLSISNKYIEQVLNPQKGVSGHHNLKTALFEKLEKKRTDWWTDRRTDRPTDRQDIPIKSPRRSLKIVNHWTWQFCDKSVTAILGWGWGWGWSWVEVEIESEVDLRLRLSWGWGQDWGWSWDDGELKFSWSWVQVELSLGWVEVELRLN